MSVIYYYGSNSEASKREFTQWVSGIVQSISSVKVDVLCETRILETTADFNREPSSRRFNGGVWCTGDRKGVKIGEEESWLDALPPYVHALLPPASIGTGSAVFQGGTDATTC